MVTLNLDDGKLNGSVSWLGKNPDNGGVTEGRDHVYMSENLFEMILTLAVLALALLFLKLFS